MEGIVAQGGRTTGGLRRASDRVTGLFETIRIKDGAAPFIGRHITRLTASCQAMGREAPAAGLESRVMARVDAPDLIARVTLDERGERIETRPVPPPEPMRIVFSGTRHEVYLHKTTDRVVFERARSRVVPFRADEALLFTGEGLLAEGCVTSAFFWLGPTLCTPSLELGILPGIGRARVLEIARERGIAVQEGKFSRAEIEGLPIFLVNSVRGVLETAVHGDWRRPKDDRTRVLAERFWG